MRERERFTFFPDERVGGESQRNFPHSSAAGLGEGEPAASGPFPFFGQARAHKDSGGSWYSTVCHSPLSVRPHDTTSL